MMVTTKNTYVPPGKYLRTKNVKQNALFFINGGNSDFKKEFLSCCSFFEERFVTKEIQGVVPC
jgi:hypothetical protein